MFCARRKARCREWFSSLLETHQIFAQTCMPHRFCFAKSVISHGSYHHQGRRGSDRPVVFWLKFDGFRRASNGRRRAPASTDGISGEKETSGRRQVGRDH